MRRALSLVILVALSASWSAEAGERSRRHRRSSDKSSDKKDEKKEEPKAEEAKPEEEEDEGFKEEQKRRKQLEQESKKVAAPKPATPLNALRGQLETHDYKAALEAGRTLYERTPTTEVLYEIARAHEGLQQYLEACTGFQAVTLDAARDDATRKEARRRIGRLQQRVGTIEITTDQDDSTVTIDGKVVGRFGPGPARVFFVAPGPHEILVSKDGRVPHKEATAPGEGSVVRIDAMLHDPAHLPKIVGPAPMHLTRYPGARASSPPPDADTSQAPSGPKPIYKRWWFWTGLAVAAAGATAFVLFGTGERDPRCGTVPPCTTGLQ